MSYGMDILSRSNSFKSLAGKAVTRPISILSLLSGIPTAMRVSLSTDRLLWLYFNRNDKVLAKLKLIDPGSGAVAPAVASSQANGIGSSTALRGAWSLSFGQLHHIASLDDMDDRGALTLSIREDVELKGSCVLQEYRCLCQINLSGTTCV
jgi:hypothetical protein